MRILAASSRMLPSCYGVKTSPDKALRQEWEMGRN